MIDYQQIPAHIWLVSKSQLAWLGSAWARLGAPNASSGATLPVSYIILDVFVSNHFIRYGDHPKF